MPIYEYKCEQTGNIFELKQNINAEPLEKCNFIGCECKGNGNVSRIISKNIGLIFNGDGFYQTDYARKGIDKTDVKPSNCSNCADAKNNGACPLSQS